MLFSKPSHSSWCRIESFSPRLSEASAVAPWNKLFPWLPWNHTLLLSSASPVTPYLPGFFSLHKEEAHHFSLSHLLIILYFSTALLGSAHLRSWLQNVAFQFCISPDLSPRLTQNPIRCCPLDDPQVLPTIRVSSWISHLLRQPHLLLLTFTNRSLPLPLLITTGNGLPRSRPCHSFSFFFSITKSCWFCLLHISQLCPICIPTVTTKVQDTHMVLFCLFFCFCLLYPIITFQCFNHLIALL